MDKDSTSTVISSGESITPVKNPVGRPLLFKSAEALKIKCDSYFELMDAKQRPYTITGLAVHLGTSRSTLLDYEDGEHSGMTPEETKQFSYTIKEAKDKCESYAEEQLFVGKNPHGVQFSMKNNFKGWRDKTETELSGNGLKIEFSQIFDKKDASTAPKTEGNNSK